VELAIDRHGTQARVPASEDRFEVFGTILGDERDALARREARRAESGSKPRDARRKLSVAMHHHGAGRHRRQRRKAMCAPREQPRKIVRDRGRIHRKKQRCLIRKV